MARARIGHDSGPVLAWDTVDVLHTERLMSAMHGGCTKPLSATWYTVYTTMYHTVPVWHTIPYHTMPMPMPMPMPCHAMPHHTALQNTHTIPDTLHIPYHHTMPYHTYHTTPMPHHTRTTPHNTIPHSYPYRTTPPPYHTTPIPRHTTPIQHSTINHTHTMPCQGHTMLSLCTDFCGFTIILCRSRSTSVGDD